MKYMLLIHQVDAPTQHDPAAWGKLSEEERVAVYEAYRAITETPGVISGFQLQPPHTATTVRVKHGETMTTDGPFAEMKEAVGGYVMYEAEGLEAAIELASRIPAARMGGAIEVRPVVER